MTLGRCRLRRRAKDLALHEGRRERDVLVSSRSLGSSRLYKAPVRVTNSSASRAISLTANIVTHNRR